MPKTAKPQTPGAVLRSYIEDFRINALSLSKSLNVAYPTVSNIINGKARISVQMALRLAQYFGNSAKYWIDIQASSEIDELSSDKKFLSSIKKIPKAKKPAAGAKKETKAKTGKRKTNTLTEKRKKAAKVSGAKKARGRKAGKSKNK